MQVSTRLLLPLCFALFALASGCDSGSGLESAFGGTANVAGEAILKGDDKFEVVIHHADSSSASFTCESDDNGNLYMPVIGHGPDSPTGCRGIEANERYIVYENTSSEALILEYVELNGYVCDVSYDYDTSSNDWTYDSAYGHGGQFPSPNEDCLINPATPGSSTIKPVIYEFSVDDDSHTTLWDTHWGGIKITDMYSTVSISYTNGAGNPATATGSSSNGELLGSWSAEIGTNATVTVTKGTQTDSETEEIPDPNGGGNDPGNGA